MTTVLIKTVYTLLLFIEILLVVYIIASWLFKQSRFVKNLYSLLIPILEPVKKMISNSSIATSMIDFSPIIVLMMLAYFEQIFYSMI